MKHFALVLLLAIVGLLAVGCGDDEEGDTAAEQTTEETAPTKEEFIAEADEICAQGDAEIETEAQEAFGQGQPRPEEGEQFVTETVLPSIQEQIDAVRELTPPEGDEETISEFLDSAESAVEEVEQDPSLIFEEQEGEDPFAESSRLGSEYGFQECAQ